MFQNFILMFPSLLKGLWQESLFSNIWCHMIIIFFDFFEKELIDLDKTIEKTLKDIMNKDNQSIFDIINVMIKQTRIQTFFI